MIHMIHTHKIVGHIFGTNVGITTLAWSTEVASLSRLGANVAKTCDTGLQDVPLTHQKEKIRKNMKIHDGRKAELLKNHRFLYGFCMVVKSRKIDMQKLLKNRRFLYGF